MTFFINLKRIMQQIKRSTTEPLAAIAQFTQQKIKKYATMAGFRTNEDVILLARVIEGEAADEPYQGKVAVGPLF